MSEQQAQHTPGPWKIWRTQEISGVGKVQNIGNQSGWPVALVFDTGDQDQMNARLIAAAPDLLAALKRLLAEADDDGITRAGVDQAFEAIAKAEGRSDQ